MAISKQNESKTSLGEEVGYIKQVTLLLEPNFTWLEPERWYLRLIQLPTKAASLNLPL